MTDEEKAAQEKVEQEKKEAEAKEAEAKAEAEKNKIEVQDGKVTITEKMYNDLKEMKDDMMSYKEKNRKIEKELSDRIEAEAKLKKEQLEKDQKFEELYKTETAEKEAMQLKFKTQEIDNALMVKAIEAGIKKSDYVRLIDKSTVKRDDDTGEISGIDDTIKKFKESNPDLFKSEQAPGVDTSSGGHTSGPMSDTDVMNMSAKDIMKAKKENSALYARWSKLATHGKQPVVNPPTDQIKK
jgi:hypothetical protein